MLADEEHLLNSGHVRARRLNGWGQIPLRSARCAANDVGDFENRCDDRDPENDKGVAQTLDLGLPRVPVLSVRE